MTKNASLLPVVAKAVALVGGVTELARALEIKPAAFYSWDRVPGRRVIAIERATGGRVTRYELRPDLHPQVAVQLTEADHRRIVREEIERKIPVIVRALMRALRPRRT